jgi:tRNA (uracil-5-)-methyltransferase TRM9
MNKKTQENLLKLVKENYDAIADQYHETRKKKPGQWEVIKNLVSADPGGKILDVGCGNGKLLDIIRADKSGYLGIDQNEKLVSHAKERYPGYNFKTGDIFNLGALPEYGFDHIFSVAVMHHIPGKDLRIKALKQLKNKLNPNGRILLTVWNMRGGRLKDKFSKLLWKFALLKLIGKNKMDYGDIVFDWKNWEGKIISRRYYHAFRKRELKKIIKKAGLKAEKIFKDDYNYYLLLKKS